MDTSTTFNALVVEEQMGVFTQTIKTRLISDLPEGDLLIKVYYSSLNYKDALSATGNKGVTRQYPHTPGIDAVGKVVLSKTQQFSVDDVVIVTSYDLGMNTSGGFSEYIRVPSAWAIKLPKNMSMKEAMTIGTAGLTAGMSVMQLNKIVKPEDGEIIVSGATGGVGALSIAILSKLGYSVSAITGKASESEYLRTLGAKNIIIRNNFEALEQKPLLKPIYAGAIDTVGGIILENMIKSVKAMGVVTCCGNVASAKLNLTVFPFILRGITLIGIDSQNCPMHFREKVWSEFAGTYKLDRINESCNEISLSEVSNCVALMLQGKLKGRTIIKIQS